MTMPKKELIETIQRILSTDADLKFLMRLNQQELETLLACIRAGIGK
jgi:DNA-binding NarL/FixJ family response regulator